jgi:hypothetical protein
MHIAEILRSIGVIRGYAGDLTAARAALSEARAIFARPVWARRTTVLRSVKISAGLTELGKASMYRAGIAAVVSAVADDGGALAGAVFCGSAVAPMKYFLRCETCGEESVRMSTFELSLNGEQTTDVPASANSPEGQFYFLHAEHLLYLMSD